jgi:hypothetical protein
MDGFVAPAGVREGIGMLFDFHRKVPQIARWDLLAMDSGRYLIQVTHLLFLSRRKPPSNHMPSRMTDLASAPAGTEPLLHKTN